MSDAYTLNEDFSLTMSEFRKAKGLGENLVSLDDTHYKKVKDFTELFSEIPSLKESISFKVIGKIKFDIPIVLRGNVVFENKSSGIRSISELKRTEFKDETIEI
jgi:UTP--glucose-1-phosphate uridylyltransferase